MSAIARIFYRWVGGDTTVPATLGLRNIYMLPTRYGMLYMVVLCAMLIGSINYNNNLGFLLTFLLGSLGLTSMILTYSMLYGLHLVSVTTMPVFAGESVEVDLRIAEIDRLRTGVWWHFKANDPVCVGLKPGKSVRVLVPVRTSHRGLFDPGWLCIGCDYPLGLFKAWTRINMGLRCLVYPRPVSVPSPHATTALSNGKGNIAQTAGVDDFLGLTAYQPGDSPGRIHWQAYSRGRGLHTKTFADQVGAGLMLDIADIKGDDPEKKLSILCSHILRSHHQRRSFGMRLGKQTFPGANGRAHRDRCLRALALYGSN